jgi:ATP-dependent DNA helicase RecG
MTLRLAPSPWRTDTFRRLNNRLENVVGAKTAKQFEPLKVWTVGDLMRHLPRRYFSGTELSDLSQLREGEEVTVLAEVVDARVFNVYDRSKKARLEATITDRRGSLVLTFFGQPRLITYWQNALQPGARGIFAGKVKEFNRKLQLAHPDFVILDADGADHRRRRAQHRPGRAAESPLIGLYPLTGKLRTWTVAECAALALDSLQDLADPLPSWVRDEAGVIDLETAFRAVHQPADRAAIDPAADRMRFDEAFALQLTMAYRRADAARHGAVPRVRQRVGCWTPSTRGCRSS